jgi:hypothetical protein
VDLGPLVGLWYVAVSVQALRLRRVTGRRDGDGPPAPAGQAEVLDGET